MILRFVPEGQEVPNVLIHLLSLIFLRMVSLIQQLSITMTYTLVSVCPGLVKWVAIGDFLCDHGRCRNDGHSFFGSGGVARFLPHIVLENTPPALY